MTAPSAGVWNGTSQLQNHSTVRGSASSTLPQPRCLNLFCLFRPLFQTSGATSNKWKTLSGTESKCCRGPPNSPNLQRGRKGVQRLFGEGSCMAIFTTDQFGSKIWEFVNSIPDFKNFVFSLRSPAPPKYSALLESTCSSAASPLLL